MESATTTPVATLQSAHLPTQALTWPDRAARAGIAGRARETLSALDDPRSVDAYEVLYNTAGVRPAEDLARRIYHSPFLPSSVRRGLARWQLLASINWPPTTYSEKLRYRMATDRRKILTMFADKVAVREYVSEKVGDQVLTQLSTQSRAIRKRL